MLSAAIDSEIPFADDNDDDEEQSRETIILSILHRKGIVCDSRDSLIQASTTLIPRVEEISGKGSISRGFRNVLHGSERYCGEAGRVSGW